MSIILSWMLTRPGILSRFAVKEAVTGKAQAP
jgi:hypothetical protein